MGRRASIRSNLSETISCASRSRCVTGIRPPSWPSFVTLKIVSERKTLVTIDRALSFGPHVATVAPKSYFPTKGRSEGPAPQGSSGSSPLLNYAAAAWQPWLSPARQDQLEQTITGQFKITHLEALRMEEGVSSITAQAQQQRDLREGPQSPNEPSLQNTARSAGPSPTQTTNFGLCGQDPNGQAPDCYFLKRCPPNTPRMPMSPHWTMKADFGRQTGTHRCNADSQGAPSSHPPRSQPVKSKLLVLL